MGSELSMSTRREITKKYAREYAAASKKDRGRMLDELVGATGWSRANARRQVRAATVRKGPQRAIKRALRPRTYGYDTLRLLIRVWMLAGQPSGKYLAATMGLWLPNLEQHEEFGDDAHRLDDHTRTQLLQISGATIDRLLKPTRDGMRLLNELYGLVRIRLNMFTATTKAIGWRTNRNGKNTRVYDAPRTPYQRLHDTGVLTTEATAELGGLFAATNPAEITRRITDIQTRLIHLAAAKTDALTPDASRAKPREARTNLSRAS